MVRVVDLQSAPLSGRFYGGHAGKKEGIVFDDACWIMKYPESTEGMRGNNLPSYTNSPISEYLGSHVYSSRGIPAHETALGFRDGSIVCICKDFTTPGKVDLVEFYKTKNTVSDHSPHYIGRPSDGTCLILNDILRTLHTSERIKSVPGVIERFWDMFVTDSFIGNADRNSENWGFLQTEEGLVLAPVYDNGNCLFNKKRSSIAERSIEDEDMFQQDAVGSVRSCYLKDNGHFVSPYKYIRSMENEECNDAVVRFAETIDMQRVEEIVRSVPAEAFGAEVLSERMASFLVKAMQVRLDQVLLPAAAEIERRRTVVVPDRVPTVSEIRNSIQSPGMKPPKASSPNTASSPSELKELAARAPKRTLPKAPGCDFGPSR